MTRPLWRQSSAVVAGQREYGAGLRWLDLDLPSDFATPVAGQFVQLQLSAPSPVLLPRPMSVAAATRRGARLRLGFLYAPVGVGTRALAQLASGTVLSVTGPLGRGFPLEEPGSPVLVAGGRGVAPLLMAADALARSKRSATFLFGARSKSLLAGLDEARERISSRGGTLHVATDDGSRGIHGDVVALLERVVPKLRAPVVVHACGPHGMLAAVARWTLARSARAHLAMESVMACGTGVCRGCPLPRSAGARERAVSEAGRTSALRGNPDWAMCCTDGPVFEARDLDWDRVE